MAKPADLLVVCDFDDTAAECNAAQLLLAVFAGPESASIQRAYSEGALPFREYQEEMFRTVTAPVSELSEYARNNVKLRPGFAEAVAAARRRGGEFLIASAGIDFYIRPVLDTHGLEDVPIFCITGAPENPDGATMSFRYDYPSDRAYCRDWAVCKCMPVERARAEGQHVIFIGDGLRSDSCAAEKVDTVFARSRLLEYCKEHRIDAIEFDDFYPIAEYISRLDLRQAVSDPPMTLNSNPSSLDSVE